VSTPRPNAADPVAQTPPTLRCPVCGLTRAELNAHGLMGCATCYAVFEALVVQATAELHGARFAEAPPLTPPRTPRSLTTDPAAVG